MKRTLKSLPYCFLLMLVFIIGCSKNSDPETPNLPNADHYITWNIDDNIQGSLTSPYDSLASARYGTETNLVGIATSNKNSFLVQFNGNRSTGMYDVIYAIMWINGKNYYSNGPGFLQVKLSKYGDFDDDIIGSYSGNVKDSMGVLSKINGNFKLKTR